MAEIPHVREQRSVVAIASFGGWAIDAFDYQLFSLAIPLMIAVWKLDTQQAGVIVSLALVCAAIGGPAGGYLSDRIGRGRVLKLAILLVAFSTAAAAFVSDPWQLMVCKAFQGLGFGAEWSVGAVMLAEIAPSRRRATFLGFMQSAWAVGWALAVLAYVAATYWLPADMAWRVMFVSGALPAAFVIWLRYHLPADARADRRDDAIPKPDASVSVPVSRLCLASVIGLGAHGSFHSVFTWLPTLLRTIRSYPPSTVGLTLLIMTVAFGAGCIAAGRMADSVGRKPVIALAAVTSALGASLFALFPHGPAATLSLAALVGFAAGGTPAILGSWFAEMFPAPTRGANVGLAYNGGRLGSAVLPAAIGWASATIPLGQLIALCALAGYGLVLAILPFLPETRGSNLIEMRAA